MYGTTRPHDSDTSYILYQVWWASGAHAHIRSIMYYCTRIFISYWYIVCQHLPSLWMHTNERRYSTVACERMLRRILTHCRCSRAAGHLIATNVDITYIPWVHGYNIRRAPQPACTRFCSGSVFNHSNIAAGYLIATNIHKSSTWIYLYNIRRVHVIYLYNIRRVHGGYKYPCQRIKRAYSTGSIYITYVECMDTAYVEHPCQRLNSNKRA